jgi:hypothetical protein
MPTKGFKSVTLKEEVYNKYVKVIKELNSSSDSKTSLSELFEWLLHIYVISPVELPRLSKWGLYDDKVLIMDSVEEKIVDVKFKEGSLYCTLCESEKCIHTGFAYALPEVDQRIKFGFKKSSKR